MCFIFLIISVLLIIILLLILYIKELNWIYNKTCQISKALVDYSETCEKLIHNQDKIIDSQDIYIGYLKMKNRKDN